MKEVKLPSGATLGIDPAPFAEAKALYQAVLKEAKGVVVGGTDNADLIKELFCTGFSSPDIEKCLWDCFKRCLYNERKIDKDTFEPVDARADYMTVCMEVAKENIFPFVKSLYAEYQRMLAMLPSIPS